MTRQSNIEWTEATWNPIRGCSKISAGCENCYAMQQGEPMGAAAEWAEPWRMWFEDSKGGDPAPAHRPQRSVSVRQWRQVQEVLRQADGGG